MRGMNQVDLAKASGVAQNTISEIELGKREARPATLRKLAKALDVEIAHFFEEADRPKVLPPSSQQLTLNGELEEERRLRYLRALRAFVHNLAERWERNPPRTAAETTPLFEAMTAVVEQGIFDPPGTVSSGEAFELTLLNAGFQRLNETADQVEKDEEADHRRATFQVIQEQREQYGT
jgi:transcriptional regulator with XRE-family HTH domain